MPLALRSAARLLRCPRVAGAGALAAGAFAGLPLVVKAEEQPKPFSLDGSKYDQSNFSGRFKTILEMIDPRTLLISNEEATRCQTLLKQFEQEGQLPAGRSDADMWEAKRIVQSVIHPVTKEPMFALGRMSCFLPLNVPICALMLSASTTPLVIASQVINQSYNVLNNYTNRSSLAVDWMGILQPYMLAVAVSCSIALGARRMLQKTPSLAKFGIFVPYLAVITAGSCNVAFTRMDEWNGRGVCIFSKEGKELGMSLKAGQQAVVSTVLTRSVCVPIPVLIFPPVIMAALPVTGVVGMGVELCVILCCMGFALPCALAILPQEMELDSSSLEPEFRSLTDSRGQPITKVMVNKGL